MAGKKENEERAEEKQCNCGSGNDCQTEETCNCGCDGGKTCSCEDSKDKLLDEYLDIAKRVQADFDNYRKRSAEQLQNARRDGMIEVIAKFLPAVDSIEKSLTMVTDEKVLEGLKMISKEFESCLKSMNVERIETQNKKYDPNNACVIATLNDKTKEDEIVLETLQCGYKIGDKIMRFANVIVNKIEN